MPTALITGITGQVGSYLADFLLTKDYKIFGLCRRSSTQNYDRIKGILPKIEIVHGDLTDQSSLDEAIKCTKPDEVYNLAAQSFVPTSWNQPVLTADVTGVGAVRLLEAIRKHWSCAKFFQASSSEMFGKVQESPQSETTPFYPRSPYGVAKVYAHYATINYRESYNLFACAGIMFNMESPRRGLEFVTRKISRGVAEITKGSLENITLGNLRAKRDWGYTPDYVKAMWLMLQQKTPEDYVIATGETHTVEEFAREAWRVAYYSANKVFLEPVEMDNLFHQVVKTSSEFIRPAEVDLLVGDASKARDKLGWTPEVKFVELVHKMVLADLAQ